MRKKSQDKVSFPGRMERRKWEYCQTKFSFSPPKSRVSSLALSVLHGINAETWLLFGQLAVILAVSNITIYT